jgi:gliding motility-associated lipoprotein GldD
MRYLVMSIVIIVFLEACKENYTPKPRGYFRVEFPKKEYQHFQMKYPYTFEYPVYTTISDSLKNALPYWININFPQLNAKIHISYNDVKKDASGFMEDSRNLAYKHVIKADAIDEKLFQNDSLKVYGILYEIKGNAASSLQFYLTDSTHHFLRGALYFNVHPNKDSLAPMIDFLKSDIIHMIETFKWNNKY